MSFYETNTKFCSKSAPKKKDYYLTFTDKRFVKKDNSKKFQNNIYNKIYNPMMIKLKKDIRTSKKIFKPLYKKDNSTKSSFFLTNNTHYPQNSLKKYKTQASSRINSLKNINTYNKMYNTTYNKTINNNIKIFDDEDDFIKTLMMKFIPKKNENKQIRVAKKTKTLNKLYGIMKEQENNVYSAKKKKYLPLEQYQHNILFAFTENNNNIDHAGFMELIQNMKKIREDTESISPLPPINIKTIYKHVFKQSKAKKIKKMTLKEYLSKRNEPKDEYEKENILINKINRKRKFFFRKRNKNLDLLPPHLKELFDKRLKK